MGAFGNELKIHTETTPGRNAPIRPRRDSDGYLSIDKSFSARWDDLLFRTAYTISTLPSPVYILDHSTENSITYLYRSYPAASAEPRVGSFAFSERRFMSKFEVGAMSDFSGAGDILRFLSICSTEAVSVVM